MEDKGSIVDRLRAQRKKSLQPKTLTLEVQGWSGLLFVRYRPAEWDRVWEMLQSGADLSAKDALDSNLDALIASCDALLVPDDDAQYEGLVHDDKGRVSLADVLRHQGEATHGEIRFDAVAVDVLALTLKDSLGNDRAPDGSKEATLAAFGGAVSPELAVGAHAAALGAWMAGIDEEATPSGE